MLRRHDDAIPYLERLVDAGPEFVAGRVLLVANHMAAGRTDEARAEVTTILQANPNLTLTQVRSMVPFSREEYVDQYLEQLRQAGVPE